MVWGVDSLGLRDGPPCALRSRRTSISCRCLSRFRAASRPDSKGIPYGMTADGRLFSFDPNAEAVTDLGPNFATGDYTAVMALSPDEKYLYYAPGAHGSSAKIGVPVVQYEIATGKRKVLAFLQRPLREQLKYNPGGTTTCRLTPPASACLQPSTALGTSGTKLGWDTPDGPP